MLIVAPSGSTNELTRLLTPAPSSTLANVKGSVPLLDAELNAVIPSLPNALSDEHGGVRAFGGELFTQHLLVFELASILILVGIIGAVHLSIRQRRRAEAETDPVPSHREEAARV